MPLGPGDSFDRYRIEQLLGSGGWGQVFRAVDTRLRRKVALKVLKASRAADAPRFLREARAAASLHHPNVVAVFDLGEAEGLPFIAMELVEGRLLSEFAGPTRGSVAQKLAWLIGVARGLGAAHEAGLLHRDIKPGNVLVGANGVVKVLDFGLAKHAEAPADDRLPPGTLSQFHTRVGHVVGTPKFMAPEALRGEPCDARADQFSWGITAYEVLSGVHPKDGDPDALGRITPLLLSERVRDVPFPLAVAIARTLAFKPADRFPDMAALIVVLESIARGEPAEAVATTRPAPEPAPPTVAPATPAIPVLFDEDAPVSRTVVTGAPSEVIKLTERQWQEPTLLSNKLPDEARGLAASSSPDPPEEPPPPRHDPSPSTEVTLPFQPSRLPRVLVAIVAALLLGLGVRLLFLR